MAAVFKSDRPRELEGPPERAEAWTPWRALVNILRDGCGVLRHLGSRRGQALVRSECPLLGIVPYFVAGQVLAWSWYSDAWWAFCGVLLCIIAGLVVPGTASGRQGITFRAWPLVPLLAGGVLMFPIIVAPEFSGFREESLLVRYEAGIRYPRPGRVQFSAEIVGRADELKTGRVDPRTAFAVTGVRLSCRGVDLPWRNVSQIYPGAIGLIRAKVNPLNFRGAITEYENGLRREGYGGTCRVLYAGLVPERGRERGPVEWVRERLVHTVGQYLGEGETSGMLLAMAFGARDKISGRAEFIYRSTGLAHLLVVSGYQVIVLFYSTVWLGRQFARLLGRPLGFGIEICTVALVFCFVLFVGGEPSSVRALVALVFGLVAKILDRGRSPLNVFIASLIIVSIIWPGAILDPGTQLTFAALFGILIGGSFSHGSALVRVVWVSVLTSMSTSIVGFYWFDSVSGWSLFLNPILAPLLSIVAVQGGIPAVLVAPLDGGWSLHFVGGMIGRVQNILEWLVHDFPFSVPLPAMGLLTAYALILIFASTVVVARALRRRGVVI